MIDINSKQMARNIIKIRIEREIKLSAIFRHYIRGIVDTMPDVEKNLEQLVEDIVKLNDNKHD